MRSFDGKDIYTQLWDQVDTPRGVVQISHGLGERADRYEDFAHFLNKNGYIVFADDHRGHGSTDKENNYYCAGEPSCDTVKDLLFFNQYLRDRYPELPLVLFGHSYGSILVQRLIQLDSHAKACVLTGVGAIDHTQMLLLSYMTKPISLLFPKKKMNVNKKKGQQEPADPVQRNAWLTRDPQVQQKYAEDPFKSGGSYARFVNSSIKVMRDCSSPKNIQKICPGLSIGIFCGEEDSAGGFGKGPKAVYAQYQQYGKDAYLKLYPGARHDILNEINRDEVYMDILNFINLHTQNR